MGVAEAKEIRSSTDSRPVPRVTFPISPQADRSVASSTVQPDSHLEAGGMCEKPFQTCLRCGLRAMGTTLPLEEEMTLGYIKEGTMKPSVILLCMNGKC